MLQSDFFVKAISTFFCSLKWPKKVNYSFCSGGPLPLKSMGVLSPTTIGVGGADPESEIIFKELLLLSCLTPRAAMFIDIDSKVSKTVFQNHN